MPRTGRPPSFPANPYILLDPEDQHLLTRSWSFLKTKYNVYAKDGKGRLLHREVTGCPKGLVVDHLNGVGLDCRRANLRVCTQSDNILRAYPKGGVYPIGSKWKVHMGNKHMGMFDTMEEAVAYRQELWETRVG